VGLFCNIKDSVSHKAIKNTEERKKERARLTAPQTKDTENKKVRSTQRKDRKQLAIGKRKENTRIFGHK
jgi:hypothetical protein